MSNMGQLHVKVFTSETLSSETLLTIGNRCIDVDTYIIHESGYNVYVYNLTINNCPTFGVYKNALADAFPINTYIIENDNLGYRFAYFYNTDLCEIVTTYSLNISNNTGYDATYRILRKHFGGTDGKK